ncbi:metalloprotease [Coraliomargarita akajimensis]|uniref:Peptidase M50 n=1 Tax=Coraliomargarita akajimensis (strain DSM 45221 / IAM 15411 / JCM 23193 / KCTC 12865 / 04OKA010-24) TaxID=583355 RepID=D5EPZ7_CORAD|nr:site-2 protease family protein [Coraliomargarita akajimensis]ADE55730.1 peptidase M50 [Coraliomargarita akajimensis DSM 45221]
MLSFRLFNIPIHVHPWFWITLAIIGGGLGANDSLSMLLVVMFVLAGFISILIHELGHALMIQRYGLPTDIHLIAFGGFARYPSGQLNRKQSFLVTATGPAIQFTLGLIGLIALRLVPFPEGSLLGYMVYYLTSVSLFWSLLNCVPIHPLDGGQMLAAIMGPQRMSTVHLIGVICSVVLGIFAYVVLGAIIIAIFMGLFAYQNWQLYSAAKSN